MTTEPMPAAPAAGSAATSAASHVSRRALLATAGLGVCGAAVVGTPIAIGAAEKAIQDAADKAFQDGIDFIITEIETIEGVAIQDAKVVAELTRLAVNVIVVPLAKLVAAVGGGALDALKSGVDTARDLLSKIGQSNAALDAFSGVLKSWHDNLNQVPGSFSDLANRDITGAETYLTALQTKIQDAKNGKVKRPQ